MNRRAAIIYVPILWAVVWTGCSVSGRIVKLQPGPANGLIFNPEWTGLPVADVARADWPLAYAYSNPNEIIEYQETIYDLQGQPRGRGGSQDYLIRRFYSVRTGRARR